MTHRPVTRRRMLASAMLGCLLPPARGRAADDELERLFSELATRRERQARFTERKSSMLLRAPVESSGTLVFRAPDILEKVTSEPLRESVRIEGNVVTYEGAPVRGSVQKRTFALSDAPLLAALIESLRATLAGDLPGLRRHYEVSWSGLQPQKTWQLTLVPRERALLDAVTKVILRGAGSEVSTVEIVEANGDLTVTRITPLPPSSAQEKK